MRQMRVIAAMAQPAWPMGRSGCGWQSPKHIGRFRETLPGPALSRTVGKRSFADSPSTSPGMGGHQASGRRAPMFAIDATRTRPTGGEKLTCTDRRPTTELAHVEADVDSVANGLKRRPWLRAGGNPRCMATRRRRRLVGLQPGILLAPLRAALARSGGSICEADRHGRRRQAAKTRLGGPMRGCGNRHHRVICRWRLRQDAGS